MDTDKLKKVAEMYMADVARYPAETQEQMKIAFNTENFKIVEDLAAAHDAAARKDLAAKITMHPNPQFQVRDVETKQVLTKPFNELWDDLSAADKNALVLAYHSDDRNALNRYEWYYEEDPKEWSLMFFYKADGIEEQFAAASEATKAWRIKNGKGDVYEKAKKHTFSVKPILKEEQEQKEQASNAEVAN